MNDYILFALSFLLLAATCFFFGVAYAQPAQLATDATWWQIAAAYWWHGLAVLISPLAGFMVGQFHKTTKKPKPRAHEIALVAGIATTVLTTWLWPGTLNESLKVGVLVGIVQPIIVWAWFAVAKRFAPQQAAMLAGNGDDLTIFPGVKIKRNTSEDTTQPR